MNKHLSLILEDLADFFVKLDKKLILTVFVLSGIGFFAIRSACSSDASLASCVPKQLIGIAAGFIMMLIIARIDYDVLCDMYIPILLCSSAILIFTSFIADDVNGNKNWIDLGFMNIQPSEFTKLAFVVTVSSHINKIGDKINKFTSFLLLCAHFLMYFIPVLMQRDLGSALIYLFAFVAMLYTAGLKYRYFLAGILGCFAAAPVIWNFLRADQKKRIIYGFQPELDPLGYGYQPLVSKMALGSGQATGLGYENGIQSQNELLPASHTDFIYAVIGEEAGFIGCIVVLALIILIFVFILLNLTKTKETNGRLICIGIACIIMSQTVINLGMVLGISPVIGVTLPFVSYGGSSVLSLYMAIGLVLSVRYKSMQDRTLRFTKKKRRYS